LTHRHYLGYSKTNFKDHVNGWNIYCSLFDQVIAMADDVVEQQSSSPTQQRQQGWVLLPEWAFDIMNEFVYEFQGFCQFRTTQAAQTVLSVTSTGDLAPISENSILDQLLKHKDMWAVEQVFHYLHRLCTYVHSAAPTVTRAHRTLGIFASVALSRLECLLGDYHASLAALSPLYWSSPSPSPSPTDTSTLDEVNSVFLAKLSLAYHAGISYLMLRRYKDAIRVMSDMCVQLANRGFTVCCMT
jgi:translation initiation factor 3 subunit L